MSVTHVTKFEFSAVNLFTLGWLHGKKSTKLVIFYDSDIEHRRVYFFLFWVYNVNCQLIK
jgi:hypothetical protein